MSNDSRGRQSSPHSPSASQFAPAFPAFLNHYVERTGNYDNLYFADFQLPTTFVRSVGLLE